MANTDMAAYEEKAIEFLLEAYGMKLRIPITRNNRLSRSLGRFIHTRGGESVGIELSGILLENGTPEQIESTLKHELIHYALFERNEPYKDGQPHFEAELVKHGASSTGTQRVVHERTVHQYVCDCKHWNRTRRFNRNRRYTCQGCGGELVYSKTFKSKF